MSYFFLILLGTLPCVLALPATMMHGWSLTHRPLQHPSVQNTLSVRLRYAGADISGLERTLLERADPHSPTFRKWLSLDEILAHTAPPHHSADRQRVDDYFRPLANKLDRSPHGDYLRLELNVSVASEIFAVSLAEFSHPAVPFTIINTMEIPRVPNSIAPKIISIHNLGEFFPVPRRRLPTSGEPGMTNNPITIRSRYNFSASSARGTGATQQGVAEFEKEQFIQSNIDTFMAKFALPNITVGIVGPNKGGYFGEGHLDLEYLAGLATNIPTWWIAEIQFDLLAWAHEVEAMSSLPSVLSISWGSGESGTQNATAQAVNAEFMKLGAMGVSILASSGDEGTGSQGAFSCEKFDPTFPASLPYITAVGGTYATSEADAEVGWGLSGGGFSAIFPAPNYQTAAIARYIANATLPSNNLFSTGGRGTPDVAALATNFEVYSGGWGTESGTSAAAPTFAAVIALLNDARAQAGKPPLGFLNPALYQLGSVGADVVSGNNKYGSCPAGFPAAIGWDAITGLGTPDFGLLSAHLGNL